MTTPTKNDLTIIIPAYNEAEVIAQVLANVHETLRDIVHEVIVVDDGSADETAAIAEKQAIARVIRHPRNRGYGAALKTGIRAATTRYVMTMDSDGQHKADDARRLYGAMKDSDIDMVVGQRTALLHSQLWRMPGKWLLGWMANYITKTTIPDLNSGLRIMKRDVVLRYMHLCPSGFSFSTTITVTLFMRHYQVNYVPITVEKRVGTSTVKLSTGLSTIMLIVRLAALFDPLRVFLPLSLLISAIGIIWGIPYALAGLGISVGSMLAIVTGILLFMLGILTDQISQLRLERYEDIS